MEDLNGKIVYQPYMATRDWLARIKYIQEAGAIAVLYETDARTFIKTVNYHCNDYTFCAQNCTCRGLGIFN